MHRDHHFRMLSTISDHKSAINPMEICSFSIFLSVKAPFFRWFRAGGHDKALWSFHQGAGGGCLAHEPAMSALHARGKEVPWGKWRRIFQEICYQLADLCVFFTLIYVVFSPWFETQWYLTRLWLSYAICSRLIFDDICFFMTFKLLTNGRSYICHPIFRPWFKGHNCKRMWSETTENGEWTRTKEKATNM